MEKLKRVTFGTAVAYVSAYEATARTIEIQRVEITS
jgi:hypothetical protein